MALVGLGAQRAGSAALTATWQKCRVPPPACLQAGAPLALDFEGSSESFSPLAVGRTRLVTHPSEMAEPADPPVAVPEPTIG